MKHSKYLLSPAQCLLRVYLRGPIPPFRQISNAARLQRPAFFRLPISKPPILVNDKLSEFIRDEHIAATEVLVKREDGHLSRPQYLGDILRQIDRENETVVLINRPEANEDSIVQVVTIQSLRDRVREREKAIKLQQQASRERKPKQIELNWAISQHDLEMKLKQMEQFLEKGKKVEIVLAPKKKARKASQEEAETILTTIRTRLVEVGAKEIKEMEGRVMGQATLHIKKKDKAQPAAAV